MMNAHDCETIADETMVDMLPEPELKLGAMKDPVKIEAKRIEAKRKQIDKMALNPMSGRLCSYSVHGQDKSEFKVIEEISDAAEIELLNYIFENIGEEINGTVNRIVTWNGYEFDFRFIYLRAALLKVELPRGVPPLNYWRKRYSNYPHCDLKCEMFSWNVGHDTNLDNTAKRFLGRGKTTRDYSTYPELIRSGEGNLIGIDNLCDTELTFDLFNEVSPYLF